MKRRVSHHTANHKNLTRLDFLNKVSPVAAEKLRQMLEENKAKEGRGEQRN
ncbi:hypothetical protein [Pectobacterium brasiliense]|uniref:hypothetical protein n=1 Tax=Pectobacterium brasiliense TaxID=180957 RepID=UPI000ACE848B|nr:hypothetical protein [Pectobacterium brasiliense]